MVSGNHMMSGKIGVRALLLITVLATTLGSASNQADSARLADPVTLSPDHPALYEVEEGDTLWDISARFLEQPWQWPMLWRWNSEIENPDLIYPGDRIRLTRDSAGPRLLIDRADLSTAPYRSERWSPTVRELALPPPIPVVSKDHIQPFLVDHTIVLPDTLAAAGIVIAGEDERLLSGSGDRVYVSDWSPATSSNMSGMSVALVRPGTVYRNPQTQERLGQALSLLAWGRVERSEKEISVVKLQQVSLEVRSGDRVISMPRPSIDPEVYPKAPSLAVKGEILAVNGGMGHVGALDVVVLNLGSREGVVEGDTLAIFHQGSNLTHPVSGKSIVPPGDRSGLLLLFRVFERLSYGLIIESKRPLRVGDLVRNP